MELEYLPTLLNGLRLTLIYTFVAMSLALGIGLILAVCQLRRRIWIAWLPARAMVEIIRGTPLLLQIFFAYFVLPQWGVGLNAQAAGVLALALNIGCYVSEVYRAGIEAIPREQVEAGYTLGLSYFQVLRRIIIPQSVRIIIPPLGNYLLLMFKDTALLSTISIVDLMFATTLVASTTFKYSEMYIVAGSLYFLISFPSSLALRALERRLGRPAGGRPRVRRPAIRTVSAA